MEPCFGELFFRKLMCKMKNRKFPKLAGFYSYKTQISAYPRHSSIRVFDNFSHSQVKMNVIFSIKIFFFLHIYELHPKMLKKCTVLKRVHFGGSQKSNGLTHSIEFSSVIRCVHIENIEKISLENIAQFLRYLKMKIGSFRRQRSNLSAPTVYHQVEGNGERGRVYRAGIKEGKKVQRDVRSILLR